MGSGRDERGARRGRGRGRLPGRGARAPLRALLRGRGAAQPRRAPAGHLLGLLRAPAAVPALGAAARRPGPRASRQGRGAARGLRRLQAAFIPKPVPRLLRANLRPGALSGRGQLSGPGAVSLYPNAAGSGRLPHPGVGQPAGVRPPAGSAVPGRETPPLPTQLDPELPTPEWPFAPEWHAHPEHSEPDSRPCPKERTASL